MAYLAVKEPTARGEKKAELRGCCSLDSGHKGAAARPLDDGALTRWGARTPVRGPATVPGLSAPLFHLLVAQLWLRCAEEKREREHQEE